MSKALVVSTIHFNLIGHELVQFKLSADSRNEALCAAELKKNNPEKLGVPIT